MSHEDHPSLNHDRRGAGLVRIGRRLAPREPVAGVRGGGLAEADPVRGEWDVVVLSPHVSAALVARDLGDDGSEADRRFEYALTYRRETVVRAAQALLARVEPEQPH